MTGIRTVAPNTRVSKALACFAAILLGCLFSAVPAWSRAPEFVPEVLRELPHDPLAFTQGLVVHDGKFVESTGEYGQSSIRIVEINTGTVLERFDLPKNRFGEGLVVVGDEAYLLTWLSGRGYVFHVGDGKPLSMARQFRLLPSGQRTEAWGLTYDGTSLIMSDGSAKLFLHEPESFLQTNWLLARDACSPVRSLNELEWIPGKNKGLILANIWKHDTIAVIDRERAVVTAWLDISGLRRRISPESGVANGIAYDATTGALYVTGKNWDKVFEIRVNELGLGRAE